MLIRLALDVCVYLVGLRIKENKEVYEGEVTEITPEYTEAPSGTGYGKAVSGCPYTASAASVLHGR